MGLLWLNIRDSKQAESFPRFSLEFCIGSLLPFLPQDALIIHLPTPWTQDIALGCFLKNKSLEFSGPDDCFLHIAANQLPEMHSCRYATLPRGVSVHVPSPFPERSLPHPDLLRSQPARHSAAPPDAKIVLPFKQPACLHYAGRRSENPLLSRVYE